MEAKNPTHTARLKSRSEGPQTPTFHWFRCSRGRLRVMKLAFYDADKSENGVRKRIRTRCLPPGLQASWKKFQRTLSACLTSPDCFFQRTENGRKWSIYRPFSVHFHKISSMRTLWEDSWHGSCLKSQHVREDSYWSKPKFWLEWIMRIRKKVPQYWIEFRDPRLYLYRSLKRFGRNWWCETKKSLDPVVTAKTWHLETWKVAPKL